MKNIKNILVLVILIVSSILITKYFKSVEGLLQLIIISLVLIYTLTFLFRKKQKMKGYFTSVFNLLTSKKIEERTFDLSAQLLFNTVKENLENSTKFKLESTTTEKLHLFVLTSVSWQSWGENIYLEVIDNFNGTSTLKIISVAFQLHSWNQNENNCSAIFGNVESSFTI